jgi:UDP-N-acetylmuramoyl-tripeptide--D-alanyl-D-alanine ligase
MYGPRYVWTLLAMLQTAQYRALPYLNTYWRTQDFSDSALTARLARTPNTDSLRTAIAAGMLAQVVAGLGLVFLWAKGDLVAGNLFGLALIVSYPLVWAHVLALAVGARSIGYFVLRPKKLGRSLVCWTLERQVLRLRSRHQFKVVAVAGSVGKTSTKLAIAQVLESKFRVRYQSGNYNDRVTVPLVFFGHDEPNILNAWAWLKIFMVNRRIIAREYPYDVVVLELGTDGPGFMQEFRYLELDVAVVTAITEEHMEFFKTLDAVAAEELTVFDFAQQVLVNGDDTPAIYLAGRNFVEYSLRSQQAQYFAKVTNDSLIGQKLSIQLANGRSLNTSSKYIGEPGARFTLAAAAVADQLDMQPSEITKAVRQLEPFAGRMQVLAGIKGSTLIDDTYNASPVAVKAALDVLYNAKTKQRIAILGSMNELGDYSPEAHKEVGEYCDPKKLALVVTIGNDASKYLAPVAKKHGCKIKSFTSPYEAGNFVASQLKKGAVVLAKGSQNRVFAEESLKSLLANPDDTSKLVRQSSSWLQKKRSQFSA